MLSTLAPVRAESGRRLYCQLSEMITTQIDLLEVSSRFGVTLSTLRKILAGGPVSPFIQKKIRRVLEGSEKAGPSRRRRSDAGRLLEIYHLYQERRTLRGVADEVGLSRERVRQLLVKGSEFGLFEYHPASEVPLPREKILADYRRFFTLKGVAQINRISMLHLKRLLKLHRITDSELKEIWIAAKKRACSEHYDAIVRETGHHPTTTELQRKFSKHYLTTQIRRLWGSIEAFRSERDIPPPVVRRGRSEEGAEGSPGPAVLGSRG
ncbi:MAG TPA: hypothetical protein VFA47_11535 [Candidatus Manganitrophaceae bacterium]|nr:hypothetical protein [Candidatus Manganitrophaceae bacterium]